MAIEHYVMEMTLNLPGGEWIETWVEVELTLLPLSSSALDLQIFFLWSCDLIWYMFIDTIKEDDAIIGDDDMNRMMS